MEVWIHILAAVSAAILSLILVIICLFCYKRYKQQSKYEYKDEMVSIEKVPFKVNPANVYEQSCTSPESTAGLPFSCSEPGKTWIKLRPNKSLDDLMEEEGAFFGGDFSEHSNEENEFSLSRYDSSESILDDGPTINFTLSWSEINQVLTVKVLNVTNLPKKFGDNCSSYVKVVLFAHKKATQKSHIRRKSGVNPLYRETFEFGGYTFQEMVQFYLKLSVYVKEKLVSKFIGDVMYYLGNAELDSDKAMVCSEDLVTKKIKKKEKFSPSRISISGLHQVEVGKLFVLLQFQSRANRLKVLIRKAENLVRKGRLPSNPDHYVIINLMKNKDNKVMSKETKAHSGLNPIWNEPFLFDIDSNFIDDYWLQILVMKGRFYSKDGILGHVLIGHETTQSGVIQWQAVIAQSLMPVEVAKWHPILSDNYH